MSHFGNNFPTICEGTPQIENEIALECKGLTKSYLLFRKPSERLGHLFHREQYGYQKDALKDLDLTLHKGEIVGIIGLNGSGKSTLSRIITGVTTPTSGTMIRNGTVDMLSASIGLNGYMTGIENIYYKCTLMGLSPGRIRRLVPKIVAFSELGEYIHHPLRTYSSGMKARLGFSISVYHIPDILIVDEALSVGDFGFAEKCGRKMNALKEEHRTILFVSHAVGQMQGFCDRVIWLHNGRKVAEDVPENLILPYCAFARDFSEMETEEQQNAWPDLDYYKRKAFPRRYLQGETGS